MLLEVSTAFHYSQVSTAKKVLEMSSPEATSLSKVISAWTNVVILNHSLKLPQINLPLAQICFTANEARESAARRLN